MADLAPQEQTLADLMETEGTTGGAEPGCSSCADSWPRTGGGPGTGYLGPLLYALIVLLIVGLVYYFRWYRPAHRTKAAFHAKRGTARLPY